MWPCIGQYKTYFLSGEVRTGQVRVIAALQREKGRLMAWSDSYIALDTETTGFAKTSRILEVGLVYFENGKPVESWGRMVNPPELDWESPSIQEALKVNGLTKEACAEGGSFESIIAELLERLREAVWVGHNISFDLRMLRQEFSLASIPFPAAPQLELCTKNLDYKLNPQGPSYKLSDVATRWGVEQPAAHRAVVDAQVCGEVLGKMVEQDKLPTELEHMKGFHQEAGISWSYRPKGRW